MNTTSYSHDSHVRFIAPAAHMKSLIAQLHAFAAQWADVYAPGADESFRARVALMADDFTALADTYAHTPADQVPAVLSKLARDGRVRFDDGRATWTTLFGPSA